MGSRLDGRLNFRGKQRLENKFVSTLEVCASTVISAFQRLNVMHICFTLTPGPVDTGVGTGRAVAVPRSHSGAQADGGCAVTPTGQPRAPPPGAKGQRHRGPSLDVVLVTPARGGSCPGHSYLQGRPVAWPHAHGKGDGG